MTRLRLLLVATASVALSLGVAHAGAPEPTTEDFEAQLRAAPSDQAVPAPETAQASADSDHGCPAGSVWAKDRISGRSSCFPAPETAGFRIRGDDRPSTSSPSRLATGPVRPSNDLRGHAANLNITFYSNSAELTPAAQKNAQRFAVALAKPEWKDKKFEIEGFTDASGSADSNKVLSERRANAVRDYLVAQGANAAKLTSKGFGSQNLALPNDPKAEANRRVMARILE